MQQKNVPVIVWPIRATKNRRASRTAGALRAYLFCAAMLAVLAVLALGAFRPFHDASFSGDIDRSIRPGDDFYRYANGGWINRVSIPVGQESFDTRAELKEKTSQQVRELIHAAAGGQSSKGSVTQKVGDYYASLMDEEAIEARGMSPLANELAAIAAIHDSSSLSAYLGSTLNSETDGLTNNADHVFGVWINQGFEDAEHNLPHLWQGGLGLPDRDDYIDSSPKMTELRARYQAHVAAMLKLVGASDAERRAARVLALETGIARAFAPDSDAADVFKQNNPWKRADFRSKAPGMDWDAYFKSAGLARQSDFLVWQPSAITGVAALVASEDVDVWKDYLRLHLLDHYAPVLPKAVRTEHFTFFGAMAAGATKAPDRETLAIAATNGALGQAVGQVYTQRYFPPSAKAKAEAMAADLIAAFRGRIGNLSWMSPSTKEKALAKLVAFKIFIGYPNTWTDYSSLAIVRGDAFGNMQRAEAFIRSRNLAQLKQPVDPIDWPLNPQTPGAVIMFSPNAEFFSAAILQPPYFNAEGDAASNYGSAGAGMAHEISHSFDELGNIYDAQGKLERWWTDADRNAYHALGAKLAVQLDSYCPLPDACVNGNRVLNESISDLAGLLVAHDAYILSLKGKPDVVIGGLSGDQRFFLAFAQRWRKIQTDAALRRQIATDTHPPGEYRSNAVRNVDAWYGAFEIAPENKLYLQPGERVKIW
jgi:predicted metalloendopeptidase